MLMEVAGKDILSGHVSLSASKAKAKKLQGKRYWETMAHIILPGEK